MAVRSVVAWGFVLLASVAVAAADDVTWRPGPPSQPPAIAPSPPAVSSGVVSSQYYAPECSSGCTASCVTLSPCQPICCPSAACGYAPTCCAPTCCAPTCCAPTYCCQPAECPYSGGGCAPANCCQPTDNGPETTVWLSAEFLYWWFKHAPEPQPFLYSVPGLAGPPAPVLGGNDVDPGYRLGGKFAAGAWLDYDAIFGLEAQFFFLPKKTVQQSAGIATATPTSPVLLIPLAMPGTLTGVPQGLFLAENPLPGSTAANTLTVTNDLWGASANALLNVNREPEDTVDLIAGFRYLQFNETVDFAASFNAPTLLLTPPAVIAVPLGFPLATSISDNYESHNHFYGGNLGIRVEFKGCRGFFINGSAQVALGVDVENFNRQFTSSLAVPAIPPLGFPGVAAGTISQSYSVNRFTVVPEGTLNVGYEFAPWLRVWVGYDFIYISDVLRPGQQVNPAGLAFAPTANHTDFWAQGVNFGVEVRF